MNKKAKFHNYMGHPVQILTEEPGKVIEIPPEIPPYEITNIEKTKDIVTVDTGKSDEFHVAIERNRVSLKSENGFPGPETGVYYLVPQIIVEAVRKSNRITTRDLIIPEQNFGIGPYQLHFANIITELNLEDNDTVEAANRTWRNGVVNISKYKYHDHESYPSDR